MPTMIEYVVGTLLILAFIVPIIMPRRTRAKTHPTKRGAAARARVRRQTDRMIIVLLLIALAIMTYLAVIRGAIRFVT